MESSKGERDSSKKSGRLDGGDSGVTEAETDRAIRPFREDSDNGEDSMQTLEIQDGERKKMDESTEKENSELSSDSDDAMGESLYEVFEEVTHENEENYHKGRRESLGQKYDQEDEARGRLRGKLDKEHGKDNKQAETVDDESLERISEEKLNVLLYSLENHVTKVLEHLLDIRRIVLPLQHTLKEQIYIRGIMVHLGNLNVHVQNVQNVVLLMHIGEIPYEYKELAALKGWFEEMQEDIYFVEYYTAHLQTLVDTYQEVAMEIQNTTIIIHEHNNRAKDQLEIMSYEYQSFNSNP